MQNEISRLSQKNYYPTLDGWRAVAIILVLACHMQTSWTRADLLPSSDYINFLFYQLGHRGVECFFALAGFLTTLRLIKYLNINSPAQTLIKFIIGRLFRILPCLFLYLGFLGVLALMNQITLAPFELSGSLFFFRNYLSQDGLTNHLWFVSLVGHFYLLWSIFFVFNHKKRIALILIIICLIVAVWRSVEFRVRLLDMIFSYIFPFEYRTDVRLDSLFLGGFLALLLEQDVWRDRFQRWNKTIVWSAIVVVYILVLIFQPPQSYLLRAICIPLIFIGTLLRPTFFVARILECKPQRWIGRISYSLFIWHVFFCYTDFSQGTSLPKLQQWPVNILLIVTVSTLSYYFVERPFVKLGHKFANRLI